MNLAEDKQRQYPKNKLGIMISLSQNLTIAEVAALSKAWDPVQSVSFQNLPTLRAVRPRCSS